METDVRELLQGINILGQNLCKLTSLNETSCIVSPIGIHSVLTLLSQDSCFFADKVDLKGALNIDPYNVRDHYKQVCSFLNSTEGRQFLRNKCFMNNRYEIRESLKIQLLNNFLYELNLLNFNERDSAIELMNIWVNDKTSDRATNLVNASNVDRNTCITLLNSTYFCEKWAKPFTKTVPGKFYVNESNIIQVEIMKIKSEFFYKNDVSNRCKILQLPFVSGDVNLTIILPDSMEKFGDFSKFHSYDISDLTDNMTLQEVDVELPKFKIQETLELRNYLSKMGLERLFVANFTETIIGEQTHLNNVQQKVFIDVNQDGLEAASGMLCSISKEDKKKELIKDGLIIYEMNIKTDISNRFAKTKVVWKTKNVENFAKYATFKVVLSETAYITGLVMEIEGKGYESYIKEKHEAKAIYNEAVSRGQSAGLVEAKTRDSKEFSVSINLEPDTVAVFTLTYEEMLQRVHDQYELVINICPGQIVDQLNIEVDIMESKPISFVKTPPLRSGKTISKTEYENYLKPSSDIQMINAKTASVKFSPNVVKQKELARYLETLPNDGLSGQFVVQYDVERDSLNSEVLLKDGYFVHFFAPNDLDPLPKHVVFVLDTSGSMSGIKMTQLKEAMTSILNEMRENDIIDIIEFNSDVIVWDINFGTSTVVPVFYDKEDFEDPFNKLRKLKFPDSISVNKETLSKAKNVVHRMNAFGSTYIIGGLETALYLVKIVQDKIGNKGEARQPIIVFLTDGEPNVGITSTSTIVDTVSRLNLKYNKVPIFSLSFGRGADKSFLRTLSLKNQGFARHIYEAADASLQLQDFYKQISSPLLSNIHFKYDSEVDEVTKTLFPVYFGGSELVVAGKYRETFMPTKIKCWRPRGTIIINSVIERPVTSLERLWAYLTVKQLLDERETSDNKMEITKKVTCLALRYHFVTDVTSLVVVKPNEASIIDDSARNCERGISNLFGTQSYVSGHLFGGPTASFGQQQSFGTSPFSTKPLSQSSGALFGQHTQSTGFSFGGSLGTSSPFGTQSNLSGHHFGGPSASFGQQQSFGTTPFSTKPLSQGSDASFGQHNLSTRFSFGGSSGTSSPFGTQSNLSGHHFGGPSASFGQQQSFGTTPFTTKPLSQGSDASFGQHNQFSGFSFGAGFTPLDQQPSSGRFNAPTFGQQTNSSGFTFGIPAVHQNSGTSSANNQFPTGAISQGATNVFGQQSSPSDSFNASFGQQSASNVFGQQPFFTGPVNSPFGQQSASNVFGTQPFSSGSDTFFGQPNRSTGFTFGKSQSSFVPSSSFPTGDFGQSPQTNNSRRSGTRIKDYEKKSFEELRFEYYINKKENSSMKKMPEEFIADHPFIIILQYKKEESVILFNGCVFEPTS